MIGKGLLRFIFHGTAEAARVILAFDTPEAAAAALAIVGEPFRAAAGEPRAIVASFTSEALQAFKVTHAARIAILPCSFRHCHPRAKGAIGPCKARSIDAMTHSADVGPSFTFNAGAIAIASDAPEVHASWCGAHTSAFCGCGALKPERPREVRKPRKRTPKAAAEFPVNVPDGRTIAHIQAVTRADACDDLRRGIASGWYPADATIAFEPSEVHS